jgi:type II secretory pathway predicted ATPase ExeA
MYRQHFGLKHAPFGKDYLELWQTKSHIELERQFQWLLQSPGLGLLTAEPGLGKTAALRRLTSSLNPHKYLVKYIADTSFGRLDFYRQLAFILNIQVSHNRSKLWRDLKEHITNLAINKNILLVLVIDEAQNLPPEFLRDLPSFLNFVFDSKDYMTVWLTGHAELARSIDRSNNTALASRIRARCQLQPIIDREPFKEFLLHGLTQAGATSVLLSDSAIEILRMASKGNPRILHQLIVASLQLATDKKLTHLPDDIIKEAVEIFKQI